MRLASSKPSARSESGNKIVRRALNKVLTVGTLVDGNLLNDDHASHCISVIEGAGSGSGSGNGPTIGIAILDAAVCEISLGFWQDDACRSKLETAIRQLRVKEILFLQVSSHFSACHL